VSNGCPIYACGREIDKLHEKPGRRQAMERTS